MRKSFDRQQRLDRPSVAKVPLNLNCRSETIPILAACNTSIAGRRCVMSFSGPCPRCQRQVRPPSRPAGIELLGDPGAGRLHGWAAITTTINSRTSPTTTGPCVR